MLRTGLFKHADIISASLGDQDDLSVELIDLENENMNDKEWDEVLEQILLAQRVITL